MNLFVCGRVCLFGEHSDWAANYIGQNEDVTTGKALVVGLNQGIYADAVKDDKFIININCEVAGENHFEEDMSLPKLKKIAESSSFFSYTAAAAFKMKEKYGVKGAKIDISKITLPIKKGLASSAAISVLVIRAFKELYDISMTNDEVMEMAYVSELMTGSKCGRLDQFCALGNSVNLVEFNSTGNTYQNTYIKNDIYMVLVDLKGKKDTKTILSSLNSCYPNPKNKEEENVIKYLGKTNSEIIERAKKYITEGDVQKLGELMNETQSKFDKAMIPVCESELKSPILHSVLSDEIVKKYTFGGKGVGSQGDGSAQFIAKDKNSQKALIKYLKKIGLDAYELTIKKNMEIKKAVIPVAGHGTRLYPYTKLTKKEFCPVLHNGMLKPQISVLLEELYDSGIEEINLIVSSKEQKNLYKNFFCKATKYLNTYSNNEKEKQYDLKLQKIWKTLRFIKNNNVDDGFACSINLSKDVAKTEPVLLCLGDTLYSSKINESCTTQLLEFFKKHQKACVGLGLIELDETKNYGTMLAESSFENVVVAKKLYEKPKREFAEKNMIFADGKCLGFFGNYVLTPSVYECLNSEVKKKKSKTQFTECLDMIREKEGFLGCLINGESFDFGNTGAYKNNFSKMD